MKYLKLGVMQTLVIERQKEFGVFLRAAADTAGEETVLLPKKQLPAGAVAGTALEVFLYKDSSDRLIATTRRPLLTVGEVGKLEIREITKIGAFLDMGLERDVLLPFRERVGEIKPGMQVLVALYVDKSDRLAAPMRVYRHLRAAEGVAKEQVVRGTVYELGEPGIYVAVDDKYFGMIPKAEAYGNFSVGQEITARVIRVREDGKLDLSPRRRAFEQMDEDAELLLKKLDEAGGSLPYHDRSNPAEIEAALGLSKNAFKRALGRLLKAGKVVKTPQGILKKS